MPRASARRSQGSQSQLPSQSQARTRRSGISSSRELSDDDEPVHYEEDLDVDPDMDVDDNELETELARKANDIVRLALFTEQRRIPLKRDDIMKLIPSRDARLRNMVFHAAQGKLRTIFGMELVELPTRAALAEEAAGDVQDDHRPAGYRKKLTAAGSKTYILRSILDPKLIEIAAKEDNAIWNDELGTKGILHQSLSDDDAVGDDDQDERYPRDYGSILSWTKSDQLGSIGILYVILAVILVSSRSMPDADLRRTLAALHLPFNKEGLSALHPVHYSTASSVRSQSMEDFLSLLLKQHYLDRVQTGGENASKKGNKGVTSKRVRAQEQEDDGRVYEWRWGPRAHCEVGEEAIGKFIAEFMVLEKGYDDDSGGTAEQQEAALTKMLKGIETAAGGALASIRS